MWSGSVNCLFVICLQLATSYFIESMQVRSKVFSWGWGGGGVEERMSSEGANLELEQTAHFLLQMPILQKRTIHSY